MRTNPSTPFTPEGFEDLKQDIRSLFLAQGGGANDVNKNSLNADQDIVDAGTTTLQRAKNLSDVANIAQAQANLGLTATISAASAASAAAGTYLLKASNLSDLANTTTALANLGLGPVNFHAYGSATQNTAGAAETAQFNTERYDVGSYFATGTYRYTPASGKYLIGYHIMFQQSISGFATDVNEAYLNHQDGNNYGHSVVSKTAINTDYSLVGVSLMSFSGSQYVEVKISLDATFYGSNTCTLRSFWGIRISA